MKWVWLYLIHVQQAHSKWSGWSGFDPTDIFGLKRSTLFPRTRQLLLMLAD